MDFFIMSLWKANAFSVWKAPSSLRTARPLTTFVIPWKPYCTAPCPDNSLDKGPRPGISQLKLYFLLRQKMSQPVKNAMVPHVAQWLWQKCLPLYICTVWEWNWETDGGRLKRIFLVYKILDLILVALYLISLKYISETLLRIRQVLSLTCHFSWL